MSRSLYLLAAAVVASLAGCNIPFSVHPLSDETTSVLDERLIGHWQAIKTDEPGPLKGEPRFVFGRVADKVNVLEMVHLNLEDGVVQVQRTPAFATTLGKERYLSILNNPEEPKDKQHYLILLYRLEKVGDEEELVKFYFLRTDVVGPAIERGDLKGEVTREPPDPNAPPPEQVKPKYKTIKITASPKELADYFAPRGDAPFYTQESLQFRRIEPQ